ncbi:MAG: DUF4386 family protein [bacterium]
MKKDWLAPLTGVAFVALVIIGFSVAGEPPDAKSSPEEIVNFYVSNTDSVRIGALLSAAAGLLFIFFANHLRRVFDAAGEAPLSVTVLVGGSVMAVGAAIDATILLAIAETADDIEATSVQTLQALWDNDFLPIALGLLVFLISAGLSILRTGALPRWLGWVALALAVIGFTPIGFAAFLGAGIWIVVVSVMLAVRAGRSSGSTPAASA